MKIGKIIFGCLAIVAIIVSFIGVWIAWHDSYNRVYHMITIPFVIIVIFSIYIYGEKAKRRGEL